MQTTHAVDAPFITEPSQAQSHYSKRFGIEASYRLSEATLISTTTQDPARRLLFVVLSLLTQNVWRYLHWEYGTVHLWKFCYPNRPPVTI